MTDIDARKLAMEAERRLTKAEQRGLRLAIACRTFITAAAFFWYLGSTLLFPEFSARQVTTFALFAFTAIGVAHLVLIGTSYDRAWIKYAVYALDSLAICSLFALVPISRADDVPQIIAFRAYGIYYLFPIVALSCLSLSWRLVLWTGGLCVVGWWAAFIWVTLPMERTLSWADMSAMATRETYEAVFLSIDFIGRGNRIEETGMLLFATCILAIAVFRSRAVFFAQVEADLERGRERAKRQHVSDLLSKYLPEEIAKKLIDENAPLRPKKSFGTALVMDIAEFTRFSSQHSPDEVIKRLDLFLTDATEDVSAENGIVISYLGDGFLVTFNAPVKVETPADAAIRTAEALHATAVRHGFSIRIGIASGELVTGTIGSDTRQSFTVYGDPVNLASRLEAKCKSLRAAMLLDAATNDALSGIDWLVSFGSVEIDGLAEPVAVFGTDKP